MTEQEWLVCAKPQMMLDFLGDKPQHRRKFRLLSAFCCRQVEPLLTDQDDLALIPLVERFADGLTKDGELSDVIDRRLISSLDAGTAVRQHAPAEQLARTCLGVACEEYEYFQSSLQVAKGTSEDANAALLASHRIPALEAGNTTHSFVLRCIFGPLPFRPITANPSWLTPTVGSLAQAIYDERAFDRMPILADALEDTGCDNADILGHCRQPGEHVRGCWVVDLVLGKK